MSVVARHRHRYLSTSGPLVATALLAGCSTLGSNVKGSFSCQAPAGVCAPSSTIDDRALAMISGDAGDVAIPAGPYVAPATASRVRTAAAANRSVMPATNASRSAERVLRVVFQPYIDDYGRLHEASAVRTVVRGEWQAAAASPLAVHPIEPAAPGVSLAEAIDRNEPSTELAASDPDLPDPAKVAAARARAADPVAAIKDDVAAKLAARSGGLAVRTYVGKPAASASPAPVSPPSAPTSDNPPLTSTSPAEGRTAADAAASRLRSDPRLASALAAGPSAVKAGAAAEGGAPAPIVRTASFPGLSSAEN